MAGEPAPGSRFSLYNADGVTTDGLNTPATNGPPTSGTTRFGLRKRTGPIGPPLSLDSHIIQHQIRPGRLSPEFLVRKWIGTSRYGSRPTRSPLSSAKP